MPFDLSHTSPFRRLSLVVVLTVVAASQLWGKLLSDRLKEVNIFSVHNVTFRGLDEEAGFYWGSHTQWLYSLPAAQSALDAAISRVFFDVTFNTTGSPFARSILLEYYPQAQYPNDYDLVGLHFTGSNRVWLNGDFTYPYIPNLQFDFSALTKTTQLSVWRGGITNSTPHDARFTRVNLYVDADQEWHVTGGGLNFDAGAPVVPTYIKPSTLGNVPALLSSFVFNGKIDKILTAPAAVTNNHTVTILGGNDVAINLLKGSGTFTWGHREGFADPGRLYLYQARDFTGTIDTTTGSAPGSVLLVGDFAPNTFSGRIIGAGGVTVSGNYILGGTAAHAYAGSLLVTLGELVLDNGAPDGGATGSALEIRGSAARVTLARSNQIADRAAIIVNRGVLDMNAKLDTVGRLELSQGGTISGAGRLTLTQGSIITNPDDELNLISTEIGLNGAQAVIQVGNLAQPDGRGLLSVTSAISNGSLVKRGGGTLSLSGNNLLSSITVEEGTIIAEQNGVFGESPGPELFILNGGGLKFGNNFETLSSGRVFKVLSRGGTIDTNAHDITVSTALSGGGLLVKKGAGTLSISGVNALAGVEVQGGVLQIRGAGGTAHAGTILLTQGSLQVLGDTVFSGTSVWQLAAGNEELPTRINRNTIDTHSASVTMPGQVSGSGGLTVTGGGSLTLTAANSYTGATAVREGTTLQISSSAALGGSTHLLLQSGGRLLLGGSASFSGRLEVNESGTIDTQGYNWAFSGDLISNTLLEKRGTGELRLSLSPQTEFNGDLVVRGGVVSLDSGDWGGSGRIVLSGGALRLLSSLTLRAAVVGSAASSVIDTGANEVRLESGLSGSMVKEGSGTLNLRAASVGTSSDSLRIKQGMVTFNNLTNLPGTLIFDGGGMRLDETGNPDISVLNLVFAAGGGILNTGGSIAIFTNAIHADGLVTKTGTGDLILLQGGSFSSGITVQEGRLVLNSDTLEFSSVIRGTGSVEYRGGGTLTLSGANTFTGGLTLGGGGDVIIVDGGTPGTGMIDLRNRWIYFNQSSDLTVGGAISGTGSLVKSGSGTLTLSGASTFTGGVSVDGGTLVAAHATALGGNGDVLLNSATLRASTSLTLAASRSVFMNGFSIIDAAAGAVLRLDGSVSSSTEWAKNGAGTLILGHENHFTGMLTVNGGTLAAAHVGALQGSTALLLNSGFFRADVTMGLPAGYNITLQNGGGIETAAGVTLTLGGVISGSPLVKSGAGALVLTNTNTFTDGIVLNGGTLTGGLAALPGNVSGTGGTLRVDESGGSTWKVQISGGVGLEIFNSTTSFGVVNLDATTRFTHTGATQIGGAVLANLNAANTLSAGSALIVNGQLDLAGGSQTVASLAGSGLIYSFSLAPVTAILANGANNSSTTFSGTLADNTGYGAGKLALWKTGTGTLTLSGANSFTGGIITSGNGVLYGMHASAFGTTGSITLSSGILRTGVTMNLDAARTLVITGAGGTLNVDADTRLTVDGTISGDALLTKSGLGTLVLNGSNTFSGGIHVTAGLIEFASPASLGAAPILLDGGGLRWATGSTGDVSERLSPFAAGGGIFDTQSNDVTLSTTLTGTGGLVKLGTGTLTLATDPGYTGTTIVVAGRLVINGSPDGAIVVGSGAEIEINGDATTPGLAGDGSMRIGSGTLTLDVASGVFTSFNGTLVANGVIKNGLGTQAFAGPNTFTGGLTINAGVLQTNGDPGLGASSGSVHFNGGTLRWGLPFDIGSTREITLQAGGGGFDVNTFTTTITQGISGSGALTKLGTGILSLQGVNTFTGGIHLDNGILVGHAASLPGSIVTAAGTILHLDQNTDGVWNASLSGGGTIELVNQSGYGVLRMAAGNAHTNTGTTLVGANLYLVAGSANTFSAASAYTVNGTLDLSGFTQTLGSLAGSGTVYSYSASGAMGTLVLGGGTTFSGLIRDNSGSLGDNGKLALVKNGAGNFRPTGTNTFSGGLTVNSGFVEFSTGANLGTGAITLDGGGLRWLSGSSIDLSSRLQSLGANGGVLDVGGNHVTFASTPTGSGRLTVQSQSPNGSLTFTAPLRHTGGTEILQTALMLDLAADSSYAGGFSGNGVIHKYGAGTLTLTGTSTFSGQIGIYGGKLVVSTASLPPSSVYIDSGTLQFDQATDRRFSGNLSSSGSGTFVKTGAGTLTLDGNNGLYGTNYILGGIIEIAAANALNGRFTLDGAGIRWGAGVTTAPEFNTFGTNGAMLDTNGNNIVLHGDFYGDGAFIKNGAGRLTLPGRTSIAGSITVNGGSLAGSSGTFGGTTPITVAAGAELLLDQAGVPDHAWLTSPVQGAGDVRVTNSGASLAVLRLATTVLFTHTGATLVDANTAFVLRSADALITSSGLRVDGSLDLGGFAQTIAKLSGGGQIYSAGSSNAVVTLTVAQNGDSTFSGSFGNTAAGFLGITALRKTGTGTLTLAGASTHSGGVTVSGGRIDFSHSSAFGSGTMTLEDGAVRWTGTGNATLGNALSLAGSGGSFDSGAGHVTLTNVSSGSGALVKDGTGTLTLAGLGHSGGTHIAQGTLALSGSSSYAGVISGGGALTKSGTGTLTMSGNNTFTGGVTLSGGFLEFSAGSLGITGAITFDGGGLKWAAGNTSDVSARFAALTSTGVVFDTGGNHITLLTPLTGSGPVTKTGAGTLTLSDVLLHSSIVTINGGTLDARNDADMTYSGRISGAGTFMKSGAGTLVLGTGHAVGAVVIAEGLIELSASLRDTFSPGSSFTLDGGGLRLAAGHLYDASADLGPLGSRGGIIDTNGNVLIAFNHVISGSGPLIKQGAGTLTLNNPFNTFTGGVIVRGGMLDLFQPESLGTGNITLDGGGIFLHDAFGLDLSTRLQPLGANGGVFATTSTQHTFSTLVTGTGSLTKQGTGTLFLVGLAHTGGTTVLQGELGFSSTAALGDGGITLNGGGLQWTAGSSVTHTAQLVIAASGGTLDTGGGDVTFTTATSGDGAFTKLGTGTLKLAGLGHAGATVINGGTLELQTTTDSSYEGTISGASLVKSGAGTLTLTSTGTALSSLTVTAGIVEFSSGSTFTGITLNGGGLRWAAENTTDISAHLNAGGSGGILDLGENDIIFASGIGGGSLVKQGSGTLYLRGTNTFTSLVVQQGMVEISSFTAMGAGTVTLNGGGLRLQQGVAIDVSSRLAPIGPNGAILDTGTNNVIAATPVTGTGVLIKTGTGRLTLTEIKHTGGTHIAEGTLEARVTASATTALTGDGAFVKSGGGTLTLDAGSYHNGITTLSEGTLRVNGYHFGAITVQNGATLGGDGVLGYVTLQNGATLAPGSSPGTLTLLAEGDGSFDFQSGSKVEMEITPGGGPSDRLNFIGSGGSTLSFLSSLRITAITPVSMPGEVFQLLDWSGLASDPVFAAHFSENLIRDGSQDNGSAWDLPDISSTGLWWDLSQFTTHGSIQIVPEPGRHLLLLAGLGIVTLRRRRGRGDILWSLLLALKMAVHLGVCRQYAWDGTIDPQAKRRLYQ